jgi:hypothetical protein
MVRLELFLSDHMGDLDTSERSDGLMEGFEAQCRPGDFLDKPMVLLANIVQIFHTQYLNSVMKPREFKSNIYPQKPC